ncbi:hypothetical protein LCGC14_2043640 [marine sediment metagenome]|uniref:Uncharacterized protein n=1 Tax=marine sediment metagenome TaxID=412755 RepID=A0A0F9ER85_9ZZZZ
MMKKLLLIAGLFVLCSAQADAATWIRGHKYPTGCKLYTLASGEWGVRCPSMNSNPQNNYWSNRKVEILPGHASIAEVAPEPKFQEPIKCRAAMKRMEATSGALWKWFNIVRYGTPDERELTGPVAKEMYERLRTYMLLAIETGDNKYRFGTRYEDRDGACANHINASRQEVLRVFNIVKAEGARGNRDLIGTGLNPRPSQFNR